MALSVGLLILIAVWPSIVAAQETNAPTRTNFTAFRLIADRNIFNASRSGAQGPPRPRETRRTTRTDTFGLVGIMVYGKGPVAFFDGSSADFRKALAPGATIAGYTVTEIGSSTVKLSVDDKAIELKVGSRLRREEGGSWEPSDSSEAFVSGGPTGVSASSPADGGEKSEAPSGPMSDILKRLMQKREQEMQ